MEAGVAGEGFYVVVVGVGEGDVDFGAGGDVADGVLEEEAAVGAGPGGVGGRREGAEDFLGGFEVLPALLAGEIPAEFQQGGALDGGSRGVAQGAGDAGGVIVPVRDEVGRHVGVMEDEVGGADGLVEVFRVAGEAVHHRVAVDSPGLPTRPGRGFGVALAGLVMFYLSGVGVVVQPVIEAVVRAEMVFEGRIGVGYGDAVERTVARFAGGPEEELEVHHVVDNHHVVVRLAVVRLDAAYCRVEAGGQRAGTVQENLPVFRPGVDPVGVAVAAIHHETDVVRIDIILLGLEQFQHPEGFGVELAVARPFVEIEQGAGVEAAAPPLGVAGFEPLHVAVVGLGKGVAAAELVAQVEVLAGGLLQGAVCVYLALGRREGGEKEGGKQGCHAEEEEGEVFVFHVAVCLVGGQ